MNRNILSLLILTIGGFATLSIAQESNGYDDVVQIAPQLRHQYRKGEVIVKFKAEGAVRKMACGRYRSAGVASVDNLLRQIGVEEVEPLMPLTGISPTNGLRRKATYNGGSVELHDMSKLYALRFDAKRFPDINEVVKLFNDNDEVEYAEPNYLVYALSSGDTDTYTKEPLYSQQWGLERVGLPQLWDKPRVRERRSVIAILDTGVDITHPDLSDNIWINDADADEDGIDSDGNGFIDDVHGWDFVNNSSNMRDNNGHGTHCAGIAAAVGNNGIGITGANPDAYIMPVTVLQSNGMGDVATIIKGIDYAVANGADIISMSFGNYTHSVAEEQALAIAYNKCVLVAAAGNDGHDIKLEGHHIIGEVKCYSCAPTFPAALNFVIGVMASQEYTNDSHCYPDYRKSYLADYSNWDCNGPITSQFDESKLYNYEIMAPGSHVLSTFPNGKYKYLSGTSMACPLVAGAISRLIDSREQTTKEVLLSDIIQTSIIQTSKGGLTGLLNIEAAASLTDKTRTVKLTAISLGMDDSEGDADGRYDAGETITLTPTIRCISGKAVNMKIWLEIGENEDASIVEFITNNVDFVWPISTYGKEKSYNSLKFKIAKNCADGRNVKLLLCMQADNMSNPIKEEVLLNVENGIELKGVLKEDMTLYPEVHYIISEDFGIPEGRTLTILPASVIKVKGKSLILCRGKLIAEGEPGKMIVFDFSESVYRDNGNIDAEYAEGVSFKYVRFVNNDNDFAGMVPLEDCIFEGYRSWSNVSGYLTRCNVISCGMHGITRVQGINNNVINNSLAGGWYPPTYENGMEGILSLGKSNVFNNYYYDQEVNISYNSRAASVKQIDNLYLGSQNADIINNTIIDIDHKVYPTGYGRVDISGASSKPSADAHGIVWKVVVDGYDARDEFDKMPPLGVGKHKFEIYYNRPVDKSITPVVSMGVYNPYTQTAISEDGAWNEAGDIYTVYLTITGYKGQDGLNRISVTGGQDLEFFEIPTENSRFNVMVQKSGTLSTGIEANVGLGNIALKWQEPDAEDEDKILGYNLCRYTMTDEGIAGDTIVVNSNLMDKTETSFVDYDVKSGVNYNYYLSQLATDLSNAVVTNTVSVTSLTATLGDANGSGAVDVADIVTDIAQMTGQNPKPFIFEAADINVDKKINILDIVGTIRIIRGDVTSSAFDECMAEYTIENGILYVNHSQPLAGLQLQLHINSDVNVKALDALAGFEIVSCSISATEQSYVIYSMANKILEPGKQPLFYIGDDAIIEEIIASDPMGKNVSGYQNVVNAIKTVGDDKKEMEISKLIVTDLSGNIVYVGGYHQDGFERIIDSLNLISGTYIVSLYDVNGNIVNVKKFYTNK